MDYTETIIIIIYETSKEHSYLLSLNYMLQKPSNLKCMKYFLYSVLSMLSFIDANTAYLCNSQLKVFLSDMNTSFSKSIHPRLRANSLEIQVHQTCVVRLKNNKEM